MNDLIGSELISGKSFLDIGCGSGIFAIAAKRLGASKVVGLDVNPICVDVARLNSRKYLENSSQIDFAIQSILDPIASDLSLPYDIVYSWGVLHHTGSMWPAISNAAKMVPPNGLFVIAIYNKHISSKAWWLIKPIYNMLPKIFQKIMILLFVPVIFLAKLLVTGKNPLNKQRGMDFYYDVIDWVGGYPYEYASAAEVISYCEKLGFRLEKLVPPEVPTGCNEFVFKLIP